MKICRLPLALVLIIAVSGPGFSQGGGPTTSLSGLVVDPSGAAVPEAEVLVKNSATSAEARAITAENGTFRIPSLGAGIYSATVSKSGFKQATYKEVVAHAGVPAMIRVTLVAGEKTDTVVVQGSAEVLQSQTATVSTAVAVNQIISLPLTTRNALDFIVMLPGISTPANTNRSSTISGLPQSYINITIDGVTSMDNFSRTSDGFFSRVAPRLDAVEEAAVSTATPGAESAGLGAVQIRFVTRTGNNGYHGSIYEYARRTGLNANSWFNNRDLAPNPETGKAPRDQTKLDQFGGRIGGPISLPKLFDGRDRAFFFINYEESRSPNQAVRNQVILTPDAELGNFLYSDSGGVTRKVNLLDLAASTGQTSTMDPTIRKLLADIRTATSKGALKADPNPLYQTLTFRNDGNNRTRFLTSRLDFNLTKNNHLEVTFNHHKYYDLPYDNANDLSPAFPGFPNYGLQGSNRFTGGFALRSTLTPRVVNEVRAGLSGGTSLFSPNVAAADYSGSLANMDGFALNWNTAALPIANGYRQLTPSRRNAPTRMVEDTLTWSRGSHSMSLGAGVAEVGMWQLSQTKVPTISFGTDGTYDPARILFDSTNGPKNFPGASSAQINAASQMYATLTGRVTGIGGNAFLDENTNQYAYIGDSVQRGHMREIGLFFSDVWQVRPGLTVNLGFRWELQFPYVAENDIFSTATVADAWGVSGYPNIFKPGTIQGQTPKFIPYFSGIHAFELNKKDFAPSFGFAWTPKSNGGLKGRLFGTNGQTVFRGGYSIAFSRMGMDTYAAMFNRNTGSFVNAGRNAALGNLVTGNNSWPVLFRDKSRLGPASFPKTPTYPMTGAITDSVTIPDPNLRAPYAESWTFGVQRELTKSTVLEVRYVGTRGLRNWATYDLNEQNIVENGLIDEFKLAMANLQANIAAGRGNTFKYAGSNTGTSPLPITLAYFSGIPSGQSGDTARYTSGNFTSSTFVNPLASTNPDPITYANNLRNDSGRRDNALKAGLAKNFFILNPDLQGGANIVGNGGITWYDAMVVELRRRMAKGLLLEANYVWSKAFSSTSLTFRKERVKDLGTTAPHAFKLNWVYEMPFGKGRSFMNSANRVVDAILGGWDFQGIARVQSGDLNDFGNVLLNGTTEDDLKGMYKLYFDDAGKHVYVLPENVRKNTIAAFNTSATSSTGYSSTYGVPTGAFIAPANSGGCIQTIAGDCAPRHYYVRGTPFINVDLSVAKRIRFSEKQNFELRGEFLNAFNNINFDYVTCASSSQSCGEVTKTQSAGRIIQIVLRLNF